MYETLQNAPAGTSAKVPRGLHPQTENGADSCYPNFRTQCML